MAATNTPDSLPGGAPYNLLGLDYHQVPTRKWSWPSNLPTPTNPGIIDAHMHAASVDETRTFLAAADAYGIGTIWTMTQLENVEPLRSAFPNRFRFIAVPRWQDGSPADSFIDDWRRRLDQFHTLGSRLMKLHQAPGTRIRWQLSLDHPQMRKVIKHAYDLGYHFMTHIGDPIAWFAPGKPYADTAKFGTFASQFPQLDAILAEFPDRIHLGAHMGGSLEDLDALAERLDRFPHYIIDSSATKWIVRTIAETVRLDPQGLTRLQNFFSKYQDRILFGSDLVVHHPFNFDHYASRYWVHLQQWETAYHGPSPIDDPDSPTQPPQLIGLNLPTPILQKLYHQNATRWLPHA